MSSQPPDEPLPLVQPGGLRESWFDGQPRHSIPPSIPPPGPSGAFLRVRPGRALMAGAIAGIVGGAAFALLPGLVSAQTKSYVDVAAIFGNVVARGSDNAKVLGVAVCAVVGLVLGALVTLATRHVKRALPIALFGLVFTPIVWLAFQSLVLPKTSPWLAHALPIGPMLVGAAAGGLCLVLAVPLKRS